MELSPAQKHLIAWLMNLEVEKDAIVGIVSILQKPEQLDAMMEWLCEHEGASTAEVLKKTAELAE